MKKIRKNSTANVWRYKTGLERTVARRASGATWCPHNVILMGFLNQLSLLENLLCEDDAILYF